MQREILVSMINDLIDNSFPGELYSLIKYIRESGYNEILKNYEKTSGYDRIIEAVQSNSNAKDGGFIFVNGKIDIDSVPVESLYNTSSHFIGAGDYPEALRFIQRLIEAKEADEEVITPWQSILRLLETCNSLIKTKYD